MNGAMIEPILHFALSALVIIGAGAVLTRCADRIAEETGVGRILIGSILLAGATSLPELMVDLNAIWLNQPNLAVGDLLGSSLFNLLILAIVDASFRHPRRAFSFEFIHHARTAALSIHLTALVGIGILSGISLSFADVGLFTWAVGVVYLLGASLTFVHHEEAKLETKPRGKMEFLARRSFLQAAGGFLCSMLVILFIAPYLVRAADEIAALSGLGATFVGTTMVALSTSLPELVATIAAFRMGAPDLALGNIFGSNTFNMLLLFPLDTVFPGPLLSAVHSTHALTAFCVVAVSSVAVFGQVSRKRGRTRLWEPSSELILLLIVSFLYLLYRSKTP